MSTASTGPFQVGPEPGNPVDCTDGSHAVCQEYCNTGENVECNGLIWRTSAQFPVNLKRVTDGLSNTMMVGESLTSQDIHTVWFFSNGDSSSTYAPLNFSLNNPDPEQWWNMRGFRSFHPAGANFAFADGSVHFISEDIAFRTYKEMSTKAAGEVNPGDTF
jgi:prepilin-type processing-associated H-X9-DG protein